MLPVAAAVALVLKVDAYACIHAASKLEIVHVSEILSERRFGLRCKLGGDEVEVLFGSAHLLYECNEGALDVLVLLAVIEACQLFLS